MAYKEYISIFDDPSPVQDGGIGGFTGVDEEEEEGYYTYFLPDGTSAEVPNSVPRSDAYDLVKESFPDAFVEAPSSPRRVEEDSSMADAFRSSASRAFGGLGPGISAAGAVISGDEEKYDIAQEELIRESEKAFEIAPDLVTLEDIGQAYEDDGVFAATAKFVEFGGEQIGVSFGHQSPAILAAAGAGLVGAALPAAVSAGALAATTYVGARVFAYLSDNLERAYREDKVDTEDVDLLNTVMASGLQAGLDGLTTLIAGAPVAGKLLSGAGKEVAVKSGMDFLGSIEKVLDTPIKKMVGIILEEEVAELGQQAAERWQAGLPWSPSDKEAAAEYVQVALSVLAPSMGMAGLSITAGKYAQNRKLAGPELDYKNAGGLTADAQRTMHDLHVLASTMKTDEQAERDAAGAGPVDIPVTPQMVIEAAQDRNLLAEGVPFIRFLMRTSRGVLGNTGAGYSVDNNGLDTRGQVDLGRMSPEQLAEVFKRISVMHVQDTETNFAIVTRAEAQEVVNRALKRENLKGNARRKFNLNWLKKQLRTNNPFLKDSEVAEIERAYILSMLDMGMIDRVDDSRDKFIVHEKFTTISESDFNAIIENTKKTGRFPTRSEMSSIFGIRSNSAYKEILDEAIRRKYIDAKPTPGKGYLAVALKEADRATGFRLIIDDVPQSNLHGTMEDAERTRDNLIKEAAEEGIALEEKLSMPQAVRKRPEELVPIITIIEDSEVSGVAPEPVRFDHNVTTESTSRHFLVDLDDNVVDSPRAGFSSARKANEKRREILKRKSFVLREDGRIRGASGTRQKIQSARNRRRGQIASKEAAAARRDGFSEQEAKAKGRIAAREADLTIDPVSPKSLSVKKREGFILTERRIGDDGKQSDVRPLGLFDTLEEANLRKDELDRNATGARNDDTPGADSGAQDNTIPVRTKAQQDRYNKLVSELKKQFLKKSAGLIHINLVREIEGAPNARAAWNHTSRVIDIILNKDLDEAIMNGDSALALSIASKNMAHEVVHGFRQLGAFTAGQWKKLVRFSSKSKIATWAPEVLDNYNNANFDSQLPSDATWRDYAVAMNENNKRAAQSVLDSPSSTATQKRRASEDLDYMAEKELLPDNIDEEAVAYTAQHFRDIGDKETRSLLSKLGRGIVGIGSVLRGEGYTSSTDLFKSIHGDFKGKLSERAARDKPYDTYYSERPEAAAKLRGRKFALDQAREAREARGDPVGPVEAEGAAAPEVESREQSYSATPRAAEVVDVEVPSLGDPLARAETTPRAGKPDAEARLVQGEINRERSHIDAINKILEGGREIHENARATLDAWPERQAVLQKQLEDARAEDAARGTRYKERKDRNRSRSPIFDGEPLPPLVRAYHGGSRVRGADWDPRGDWSGTGEGFTGGGPLGMGVYFNTAKDSGERYLKYGGDSSVLSEVSIDTSNMINIFDPSDGGYAGGRVSRAATKYLPEDMARGLDINNLFNKERGGVDRDLAYRILDDAGITGAYEPTTSGVEIVVYDPSVILEAPTPRAAEDVSGIDAAPVEGVDVEAMNEEIIGERSFSSDPSYTGSGYGFTEPLSRNADQPVLRPGQTYKFNPKEDTKSATWGRVAVGPNGKASGKTYPVLVMQGHEEINPETGKSHGYGAVHMREHNKDIRENTIYGNWEELLNGFFYALNRSPLNLAKTKITHYSPQADRNVFIWADDEVSKTPVVISMDLMPRGSANQYYSVVTAFATNKWGDNAPVTGNAGIPDVFSDRANVRSVLVALRPDLAEKLTAEAKRELSFSGSPSVLGERSRKATERGMSYLPKNDDTSWDKLKGAFSPEGMHGQDFRDRWRSRIFERFARIETVSKLKNKFSKAQGKDIEELAAFTAHAMALRSSKTAGYVSSTMIYGRMGLAGKGDRLIPVIQGPSTDATDPRTDPNNPEQPEDSFNLKNVVENWVYRDGKMVRQTFSEDLYDRGVDSGFLEIIKPLAKISKEMVDALWTYSFAVKGQRLTENNTLIPIDESDLADAMGIVDEHPEIAVVHANLQKWNEGLVNFLRDTGVIKPEMADVWLKYADYIPFYLSWNGELDPAMEKELAKVTGQGTSIIGKLVDASPPPKMKGRKKGGFMDPIEAISKNANAAIHAGLSALAGRKTVEEALALGEVSGKNWIEKATQKDEGGKLTVTIRENGEDAYYNVIDPMLYEALSGVLEGDLDLFRTWGKPAQWLRESVTRSPEFMIANLLRDSLHVWTLQGAEFAPIGSALKQWGDNVAKHQRGEVSDSYRTLSMHAVVGGGYDQIGKTNRRLKRMYAQGTDSRSNAIFKVWDWLGDVSGYSESSVRQRVFDDTVARMQSEGKYEAWEIEAEAAHNAQEVLNFNRRGANKFLRFVTATVPFVNARLQGLDQFTKAMAGERSVSGMSKREAMNQAAIRALYMSTISFFYTLAWWGEEGYENERPEIRDDNWLIPTGLGMVIRIPIPFETGIAFKVVPEVIARTLLGASSRENVASLRHALASTIGLNPVPQAIKPLLEVGTNFNLYTMSQIVPFYEEGLGGVAATTKTPAPLEILGNAADVNPRYMNHLIRGYTATVGSWTMSFMDLVMRNLLPLGYDERPDYKWYEAPLLDRFLGDSEVGSGGLKDAYYDWRKVSNNIWRKVLRLRKDDPERASQFMTENKKQLAYRPLILAIDKKMKALREQRNAILRADEDVMDGATKRVRLNEIAMIENQILRNIPSIKRNSDLPMGALYD